ncbi:hypothetical protein M2454_000944 [Aequitasia blattaphilus]|uniref:DUF6382 domain-containing protein n=1 Tax=Aequitasia blattaphilus TaxID=2949332 RepID=A0ABT1E9D9_9FIRM|nr:DUF6382 domain-containing protein [Aequitasia blattaphilus]MCP1102448.1 DUF6382 domain-containing protein [Aequitasia blattaphilus]MCR8615088.1 DUF6382 domain-containing protein [Aequitasia blattaphilus]
MERIITIEAKEIYREDYQIKMIRLNKIEGLLPIRGIGWGTKSQYSYKVNGKVSMGGIYERGKVKAEDINSFAKNVLCLMDDLEKHLLDINKLLFQKDYIFYGRERFYFCYYPPCNREVYEEFHELMEYFVKHIDYNDEIAVEKLHFLYDKTREENYDLEELLKQSIGMEKSEEEEIPIQEISYIDEEEKEEPVFVREKKASVICRAKKMIKRRKKKKWGDFDDLLLDEEV